MNAAFAFGGTELVGLAAAETSKPQETLPRAIKQVFWRITLFYIVALTVVGLLVPFTDSRLIGSSSVDVTASPFVIAIENAGISGLPSVMNVVILVSVLSVGNSSVYGSSRIMAALSDQGQAPKFLAYVDRKGRPLWSIVLSAGFGLLCFLAASDKQTQVFEWLLALAGLSEIFTWGSICLCHIRFRRAWTLQGRSLDTMIFRSQPGVIGSWFGFCFNCLVLVAQVWVGFAPIGWEKMSSRQIVETFFSVYLAAPVILMFYGIYKWVFKTKIVRAKEMDITTGHRDLDSRDCASADAETLSRESARKRLYKWLC